MLVFVFDPLAIMLLLATTQALSWRRKELKDKNDERQLTKQQEYNSARAQKILDNTGPVDTKYDYDPEIPKFEDVDQETIDKEFKEEAIPEVKKQPDNGDFRSSENMFHNTEVFNNGDWLPVTVHPFENEWKVATEQLAADFDEHVTTSKATLEEDVGEPEEFEIDELPGPLSRDVSNEEVQHALSVTPPSNLEEEQEAAEDRHPRLKQAKQLWKLDNPLNTLKEERRKFNEDLIPVLPWIKYLDDPRVNQSVMIGSSFPRIALKGDTLIRTDRVPTQLYKFNGDSWMEISKETTDVYSHSDQYIDYLIAKVGTGEYDPELLTDSERLEIENRLGDI